MRGGGELPTRWGAVAAVVFAGIAIALQIGKVPAAVPLLTQTLHLDLVAVGWLLSLLAAVGAIGGSAVGIVTDRLGHRRALLAGLACATVGSLLGAQAESGALLLASRGIESIGAVLTIVAAPVLIWRDTRPRDIRLAFGLWGIWMPAGAAPMIALSLLLLAEVGWRGSWLLAALVSLLAIAVAWRWVSPDARPSAAGGRGGTRGALAGVLKLRVSWLLSGNFCLYSMSFMTVFGFLPTFLVGQQHFTPAAAAALTAVGLGGNVVGNLLAGWLARHGVARWQLVVAGCLVMGLVPWGIFSDTLPLGARYALCLAFAIVGGFIPASVLSSPPVFAPSPAHVPTLGGMLVQGMSVGQIAGPPLLAFLVQTAGGWSVAPWYLSVTGAAGIVLGMLFRLEERKATSLQAASAGVLKG